MPEFISVIEFTGPVDLVVWKSPVQNFNNTSQLIVDEGHWAIVLIEGQATLFGPGRHSLETSNLPFLRGIQAFATGGETMYPCQVFFVKQVHSMDLLWGSKDLLTVNDPQLDILMNLMIRGNLTYAIDNPIKFVEKFCGFATSFSPDEAVDKLRGIISTEVSDCIAKIVTVARIGYLEINAHLKEISALLQDQMTSYFDSYGINLVYFMVETITSREDDLTEVKNAKAEARARVIDASGQAQAREIQGYSWIDERKTDILQALANNQGSIGGMMGLGVGMVTAGGMGSNLSGVVNDIFSPDSDAGASPFQKTVDPAAQSESHSGPRRFGFTSTENPAPVTPQVTVQGTPHVDVYEMFSQAGSKDDHLDIGNQPQAAPTGESPSEGSFSSDARSPMSSAEPVASSSHELPRLSFDEVEQRLTELQRLLALGLITQDDFTEQKKILLSRM